jgi:predicted ArsR family transcriptional regulator
MPVKPGRRIPATGTLRWVSEDTLPTRTTARAGAPRLAVLKALGDNTRYAIYLELARSSRPLATAEIAETLDLHPNTVRPHLERMREVGLLDVETDARGTVGRPQHRYSVAADAPTLGLEPATFRVLSRMLVRLATTAGLGADEAVEAGREQGGLDGRDALEADSSGDTDGPVCLRALVARLDALGFDPAVVDDDGQATVAFTHCPFRELAERHPDVVCGLHRGLVEGFVDTVGGARVDTFHPLTDRTPCQVELEMSPS